MRSLRFLSFLIPVFVLGQVSARAFTCNDPPAGEIILFQGAIQGFPSGDILNCGTAAALTPTTCQLFNRVYTIRESACVNAEHTPAKLPGALDYIPNAFFPRVKNSYESDVFTLGNWAGDLGSSGTTWILLWEHVENPGSSDYAGYYAAQSDVVRFGERGNPARHPCECSENSCRVSCPEPWRSIDIARCPPVLNRSQGIIPPIGSLAPVPVPQVDSVSIDPKLGFADPAARISLAWQPACAATSRDGALNPLMGYSLEVFVDRNGNGQPEAPPGADLNNAFYQPILDIAPVDDPRDGVPNLPGGIATSRAEIVLGSRTGPGDLLENPRSIEALVFRLRILYLDDRVSPDGIGGRNGAIDAVLSPPSAHGPPISSTSCEDADGDGYGVGDESSTGIIECAGRSGDCDDANPSIHPSALEICDGLDNDCDGQVDEGLLDAGTPCTTGIGVCAAAGVKVCRADGTGTECDAMAGRPGPEECDGVDNDCDGSTDEEFADLGEECVAGVGICQAVGRLVCAADGTETECDGIPGSPEPEICDGIDNDCDGIVDGFPTSCGIGGCAAVGNCRDGVDTCVPGNPSPEVCDGLDNDCDGKLPGNEVDGDGDGYPFCAEIDDTDADSHPGASEVNDGRDNQISGDPGFGLVDEISEVAGFFNTEEAGVFSWSPGQTGAIFYQVARSTSPDFSTDCVTFPVTSPRLKDQHLPEPGQTLYYLVRPLAPFVGSWGWGTAGDERKFVCGREVACANGIDDDTDGLADCDDTDCRADSKACSVG